MSMITVCGAGAFGTALAVVLAADGTEVTLWARDPDHASRLSRARRNDRHLPDAAFPESLAVTSEPNRATGELILLAIPMQALSGFLVAQADGFGDAALVACCKGVDLVTGDGPSAVIARHAPHTTPLVLSGPSFAVDIAVGLPTALTLACSDISTGAQVQESLSRRTLRLYATKDVIGTELGGALKNVMALAAGITIGAGLGESARAAVVTRGFAEMRRISDKMGADPDTLSGLSGLGDLILTATSPKSRNYSAGLELGAGKRPDPARTIEGLATAEAVARLARDRGIDAPLTRTVADIAAGRLSVEEARTTLLARPLRRE